MAASNNPTFGQLRLVGSPDPRPEGARARDGDVAQQLHDYAVGLIQGLFNTSVHLRSAGVASDLTPAELSRLLGELDGSIAALRLRLFDLEDPPTGQAKNLWSAVQDLCHRAEMCLGVPVRLKREGSVDVVVSPHLVSDVTAVVRAAVSLAVHVARSVQISIQAGQVLLVDLRLEGVTGLDKHREFVQRMAAAARRCGSVCETETHGPGGVFSMHWAIPLPERL